MRESFLVVNLNQVGAVVLSLPVFAALRRAFPQAFLATLVREAMIPLLEGNPYIDVIIGWEKKWSLKRKWEVVKALRVLRCKVALNLSHSFERCLLTWLSGARVRIGFQSAEASFFLTHRVAEPPLRHSADLNLDLVRALGVSVGEEAREGLRIWLKEEDRIFMQSWIRQVGLKSDEPLVALNPGGATSPLNRWMPEAFGMLALILRGQGCQVAVLGGQEDLVAARQIRQVAGDAAWYLTGQLTLRQLVAFIAHCDVLVTGDTGPMHIATAVDTPVVALFGRAEPRKTGPFRGTNIIIQKKHLPCVPCLSHRCRLPFEKLCMHLITPQEVAEAVLSLLSKGPSKRQVRAS
jgi:lipopolysaccharide heptosyltransferase II